MQNLRGTTRLSAFFALLFLLSVLLAYFSLLSAVFAILSITAFLGPSVTYKKIDLFEPPIFLSVFILTSWVLPITIVDYEGLFDVGDMPTKTAWYTMVTYTFIGLTSFTVGYNSKLHLNISRYIPRTSDSFFSKNSFLVVAGLALIVSTVSMYYALLGNLGAINIRSLSIKREIASGYIRWLCDLSSVVSVLLFASHLYRREKKSLIKILLFLSVVASLVFNFIISNRSGILTLFISFAVIYYYQKEGIKVTRIVLAAVILLVIGTNMGKMRGPSHITINDLELIPSPQSIKETIVRPTVAPPSVFANLISSTPEQISYQKGSTLVTWTVFPVPRSIWSNKPTNLGQKVGSKVYNQGEGVVGGGTPPPFIGELYLNFHLVGVIVGMCLFGVTSRALYFWLHRENTMIAITIFSVFLFLSRGLFGGDFSKFMVGLLKWIIPILVISLLSRKLSFA